MESQQRSVQKFSLPSKSSDPKFKELSRPFWRMHPVPIIFFFIIWAMDIIDKILHDTLEQGQLLFLLYPEWLQTAIVDNPALNVWNFGMCGMGWLPYSHIATWKLLHWRRYYFTLHWEVSKVAKSTFDRHLWHLSLINFQ